jgi:hypothetical protein
MRLLLFAGLAAVATSCGFPFPGGQTAKVSCAKSANSCRCQNSTFTLLSDETTATSCDQPLSTGVATCCYDLDSSGQTTTCDCTEYACYETSTTCECGNWRARKPPTGSTRVSSCAAIAGSRTCCWGNGYDCTCQNYNATPFACATGTGAVSSCPAAADYFSGLCGGKTASTCSGLTWKP